MSLEEHAESPLLEMGTDFAFVVVVCSCGL